MFKEVYLLTSGILAVFSLTRLLVLHEQETGTSQYPRFLLDSWCNRTALRSRVLLKCVVLGSPTKACV